jgi:uncharacterized heparinase superfamily protein
MMVVPDPDRLKKLFHTVRYLRWSQIAWRLWYRCYRPRRDTRVAPSLRELPGRWVEPVAKPVCMTGPADFRFLNEDGEVASPDDWDRPAWGKLWRYNLHYFDDLNAENTSQRGEWHRALIDRWIAENPPGAGTGWEPYPTSLRIVNWVKWALGGTALETTWVHSLAVQTRWLARKPEYHLLGNHLLANGKALVFAGLFFDGPEAARWLRQGERILGTELPEQVLPDGGHFERSPMYHAIVFEDLLDLINLYRAAGRPVPDGWSDAARRMAAWLPVMCHPDGEIGFFNDAAFGIASPPARLYAYAERLGVPVQPVGKSVTALADSGYVRLVADEVVCLADVAPVGPDYLPGHAHADTLSFEVSLFGYRVFVNSGTSVYGIGSERERQRGTAAHNTVLVDGEDSSEVWSGFRVARRAYPFGIDCGETHSGMWLSGAHDGYSRFGGDIVHRRYWQVGADCVQVRDRVTGAFDRACARFHLHPAIETEKVNGCTVRLRFGTASEAEFRVDRGSMHMESSTWHPRFGVVEETQCLVVELDGGESGCRLCW